MDTVYITDEAYERLLGAADTGSYSRRAVTMLDDQHNVTDRVVPGKLHWIVVEDAYDATVLCIQHDGKTVLVDREI